MAENEHEPRPLTDEELELVFGAETLIDWDNDPLAPVKVVLDSKGREIGKYWKRLAFYWPCPNCGRPTHWSLFRFWCDKCDASWSSLGMKMWSGTVDEFLDAADAN